MHRWRGWWLLWCIAESEGLHADLLRGGCVDAWVVARVELQGLVACGLHNPCALVHLEEARLSELEAHLHAQSASLKGYTHSVVHRCTRARAGIATWFMHTPCYCMPTAHVALLS